MASWKAENTEAGRSDCRTCQGIEQDLLRLGDTIDAPHSDGVMTDYDEKVIPEMKSLSIEDNLLAQPLKELMELICDPGIYRATITEYGIDLDAMPIGKLTEDGITEGDKILKEITESLNDPTIKEDSTVAASKEFFNVIPSIRPQQISKKNLKKNMDMVKFLRRLEGDMRALRALGIDIEDDEPLNEKYKKLKCDIAPLPHDSDDYKLVEKYLVSTHDPKHKDWDLDLEEVFTLNKEGESDNYATCGDKLHNKMLLWRGIRLTNVLGILGQGSIAPIRAPGAGNKFGGGVYFADMVSMAAQYCRVKDGVGLLLLAEVALGDMHELTQEQNMENPPEGKHSTKGIGRMQPSESEHVPWRDGQVMVPCGKATPKNVITELPYNEYIVYNPAQVKLRFLVKVRFHPKWSLLSYLRNLFVRYFSSGISE